MIQTLIKVKPGIGNCTVIQLGRLSNILPTQLLELNIPHLPFICSSCVRLMAAVFGGVWVVE